MVYFIKLLGQNEYVETHQLTTGVIFPMRHSNYFTVINCISSEGKKNHFSGITQFKIIPASFSTNELDL